MLVTNSRDWHEKMVTKFFTLQMHLKIQRHSSVSAAKKAVWCTSVLFTETANFPFLTPRISIPTGPISIRFTYFYALHICDSIPSLKKTSPGVHEICVAENCPIFFTFLFFFSSFYKYNLEPIEDTLLIDRFLLNLTNL